MEKLTFNPKYHIWGMGLIMILFFTIAVSAIGLAFTPVKIKTSESIYAPPAVSIDGLKLRAEAWKVYPTYNIGLGLIALTAFAGAILSIAEIYSLSVKEIGNEN